VLVLLHLKKVKVKKESNSNLFCLFPLWTKISEPTDFIPYLQTLYVRGPFISGSPVFQSNWALSSWWNYCPLKRFDYSHPQTVWTKETKRWE